jgi:hypothetical protein
MRSRIVLAFAAVLVIGVLAVLAVLTHRAPQGADADLRFAFPAGTRLEYAFTWKVRQRAAALAVPGGDEKAAIDFGGRLALVSHGEHQGGWLLEATVDVEQHELVIAGRELLSNAADVERELGARRAFLELSPDGTVRAVSFLPDATQNWRNLATELFGTLEVVIPRDAGASWNRPQIAPFGRADTQYERDGARLERRRTAYTALDAVAGVPPPAKLAATGTVELAAGHLVRLDDDEAIAVTKDGRELLAGEAHVHLELRSTGHVVPSPVAVATLERRRPGERIVDPGLEQAALEARIDGLTIDQFTSDLLGLGDIGVPDEHRWMWRASALLQLHPELCGALVAPFTSGRLGRRGGALTLDLLAAAGTPAAQSAMRAMLASPAAHAHSSDYVRLVQRFAFVERPDADSVAFLRNARRSGTDVDASRAATYALGNAAGALAKSGDTAGAASIVSELTGELATARTPADRAALVGALTGAHSTTAADAALALASDDAPQVRAAVAHALVGDTRSSTDAAAVALAADGNATVQYAALSALSGRKLGASEIQTLAQLAVAPINEPSWLATVDAQLRGGADPAAFRAALERLSTSSGDARVRTQARRLLGPA